MEVTSAISHLSHMSVLRYYSIYMWEINCFSFLCHELSLFHFLFLSFLSGNPLKCTYIFDDKLQHLLRRYYFVYNIFNRSVIIRCCREKFSYLSLLEMKRDKNSNLANELLTCQALLFFFSSALISTSIWYM